MNIIRTKAIELSSIPALAYKQKLASGGAGVKILRMDCDKSAVFTIDKRTGEPVPYGSADAELFPEEALEEALELTGGQPYSARGNIRIGVFEQAPQDAVSEDASYDQVDMTLSPEYAAIVDRYSDEKGKLNYQLMNKDFIQFASKSKVVGEMVANKASQDEILLFIIKSRATLISGRKESLDDESVKLLIETLDEIDPRSAFKELKAYINRLLARKR